jgi:aldehyde dehydrogenase (NAD+)
MSATTTDVRRTVTSRSPVTGAVIGEFAALEGPQVRQVVDAARVEQQAWGAMTVEDRCEHLKQIQHELAAAFGDLCRCAAAECGKPLNDAMFEGTAMLTLTRWVRKHAPKALRPRRVPTAPMFLKTALLEYSPYGVIGVIAPWNYPLGIPFQSIPWILACGNTVVLKPSELTPATGVMIGEVIARAGRDLVKVVTGYGSTGAAVIDSGVDKLVFTGSGATGRRILETAAKSLTPVVMELGGKDAMIVCDDADIVQAAKAAVGSAFSNAGQTCMATERAIVTDRVYDAFVDAVRDEVARLTVSDADGSHVGAMTQPQQAAIISRRIEAAIESGARIAAKGADPGEPFFPPTVLVDVPVASELWREESFGPVMSIARVASNVEALELANDTEFGLNGSVFAKDRATRRSLASAMVAGGVNINDALIGSAIAGLPFGGERASGYGRLQGVEAFSEFSRVKSITDNRVPGVPSLLGSMFTGKKVSPVVIERFVKGTFGAAKARGETRR